MARFSYKDCYFEFATVELTGVSNTCELSVEGAADEITCFQESWDVFLRGVASWSISLSGFNDQTAGNVEDTLYANITTGPQAIEFCPQDQGTGYKFTGDAILTAFAIGGPQKGGCPFTATFQGSGTLSRSAA